LFKAPINFGWQELDRIDENPEIVIGLVAPLGVDLSNIENIIADYLKQFQYKPKLIDSFS